MTVGNHRSDGRRIAMSKWQDHATLTMTRRDWKIVEVALRSTGSIEAGKIASEIDRKLSVLEGLAGGA